MLLIFNEWNKSSVKLCFINCTHEFMFMEVWETYGWNEKYVCLLNSRNEAFD